MNLLNFNKKAQLITSGFRFIVAAACAINMDLMLAFGLVPGRIMLGFLVFFFSPPSFFSVKQRKNPRSNRLIYNSNTTLIMLPERGNCRINNRHKQRYTVGVNSLLQCIYLWYQNSLESPQWGTYIVFFLKNPRNHYILFSPF